MSQAKSGCSRRDVLKLATGSTVITALSGLTAGCGLIKSDLDTAARRMIETLNHLDRARELGGAYMAQSPDIRAHSPEQLTRKLLRMLDIDDENISDETLNALETRLSDRVRRDFLEENVVVLGRWMLSQTELLLCALANATT